MSDKFTWVDKWQKRVKNTWSDTKNSLPKLVPIERVAETTVKWFSVNDDRVAEILQTVRAKLPTTEALLIGKPQAGKSSIIRGLTGVDDDIVGQGFRPHTQHTERYAYPSEDVPLLIFTDTVGLGDGRQDTQEIVAELAEELSKETHCARILILTVKINDFATASLKEIATQLRAKYPNIPCLLAVTCLHEVYPPQTADHPDYPPTYPEIQRAFTALQTAFADICDRAILIDFTLEEDEYHPVFYGLEALRDTLADLLPQAEANAIYQLLDATEGDRLRYLFRNTA